MTTPTTKIIPALVPMPSAQTTTHAGQTHAAVLPAHTTPVATNSPPVASTFHPHITLVGTATHTGPLFPLSHTS